MSHIVSDCTCTKVDRACIRYARLMRY